MKALLAKHPVASYFALTFAISWGGVLVAIGGPRGIPGTQEQFDRLMPAVIVAMLAGPSMACLLLTGVVDGRAGYRDLRSRLLTWRVEARWYASALLIAPFVFAVVPLAALALTGALYPPAIITSADRSSLLLSNLFGSVVVGFLEELGWTGFAIPKLRQRYSVIATGLIVGVAWGIWHVLTNDLWAGASSRGAGDLSPAMYVTTRAASLMFGGLPAFRVLMVWTYDRTGSLLLAMLMHASYAFGTFTLGSATTSGSDLLIHDFAFAAMMWIIAAGLLLRPRMFASILR